MAERWRYFAAAAVLLTACARDARERITLGTSAHPAYGLVFIAEAKGYFSARGLIVEQRRFTSGRDAIAALAAGEVDAATAHVTPVAVRAARDDLLVLTTLHASTGRMRVVARADRGVARAADLAGKRIGVSRGTNAEYFLHVLLAYAGVEPRARVVDVAPHAAVDALLRGEVDAIATWPPLADRASALAPERVVELRSDVYTELSVLATRDATHRARRGALVKLTAALADAERLVRERPEEAFQALRQQLADIGEADLREEWFAVAPALGITHELATLLEQQGAWFRSRVPVAGPSLDLGAVLEPDVLAEVDPEAVTFVFLRSGNDRR